MVPLTVQLPSSPALFALQSTLIQVFETLEQANILSKTTLNIAQLVGDRNPTFNKMSSNDNGKKIYDRPANAAGPYGAPGAERITRIVQALRPVQISSQHSPRSEVRSNSRTATGRSSDVAVLVRDSDLPPGHFSSSGVDVSQVCPRLRHETAHLNSKSTTSIQSTMPSRSQPLTDQSSFNRSYYDQHTTVNPSIGTIVPRSSDLLARTNNPTTVVTHGLSPNTPVGMTTGHYPSQGYTDALLGPHINVRIT